MTRPDKRAARFGDRYRPPLDWRRLHKAIEAGLPLIKRMTEAFRQVGARWTEVGYMGEDGIQPSMPIYVSLHTDTQPADGQLSAAAAYDTRYARSSYPISWSTAGTVTAALTWTGGVEAQERARAHFVGPDILDRIDDTLISYDAQRSTGEPWPYEEF